jgi:hypothetical protein
MGIILGMYAERRLKDQWHFLGKMEKNPLHEIDSEHQLPNEPESLYDTENSSLCSILADVRNSGVLEEKYDCITSRRGVPEDLSPELKTFAADHRNQHSSTISSWLTLEELATFDWRKIRKQYAIVDKRVVHLFHPERGFPFREWPRGIGIGYSPTAQAYANVSWTETYADAAGWDFMELVDGMVKTYGVTNDVRFILWFSQ